jgi:hypothetical protein
LMLSIQTFAQTTEEAKLIQQGKCIPYRAGVTGVIKKYMCHQDGTNPAKTRAAAKPDESAMNTTTDESYESAARPTDSFQSAKSSSAIDGSAESF